jgi:hypothetical protein
MKKAEKAPPNIFGSNSQRCTASKMAKAEAYNSFDPEKTFKRSLMTQNFADSQSKSQSKK